MTVSAFESKVEDEDATVSVDDFGGKVDPPHKEATSSSLPTVQEAEEATVTV